MARSTNDDNSPGATESYCQRKLPPQIQISRALLQPPLKGVHDKQDHGKMKDVQWLLRNHLLHRRIATPETATMQQRWNPHQEQDWRHPPRPLQMILEVSRDTSWFWLFLIIYLIVLSIKFLEKCKCNCKTCAFSPIYWPKVLFPRLPCDCFHYFPILLLSSAQESIPLKID